MGAILFTEASPQLIKTSRRDRSTNIEVVNHGGSNYGHIISYKRPLLTHPSPFIPFQFQFLCRSRSLSFAARLNHALGSNVTLSRDAVRNTLRLVVVLALELRATGAGRVAAYVCALSFLAPEGEIVSGSEAGSLRDVGADNIVVVVAAALVVGLGELVERTALTLVVLTTGLSGES
jgi:hypothetical protein